MDMLYLGIIIGLIAGSIGTGSIIALFNLKKINDMQDEINSLKKEVAFNKKMRQSVD